MSRPRWEMADYDEMEAYLARARKLRSEAVMSWLETGWRGLMSALDPRRGHPEADRRDPGRPAAHGCHGAS